MTAVDRIALDLGLEPDALPLLDAARPFHLAAGDVAFRPGSPCPGYILLEAGQVSVRELGPEGREILLYRLKPGETCLQTALCLLGDQTYTAEATADTRAAGLLLPAEAFDALMARSAAFRRHVFRSVAARLEDFSRQVGGLAFATLETRLAGLLLERADADGVVTATHEALARELGAVREPVSRALGALEKQALVRLGRGRISITDRTGLRAKTS